MKEADEPAVSPRFPKRYIIAPALLLLLAFLSIMFFQPGAVGPGLKRFIYPDAKLQNEFLGSNLIARAYTTDDSLTNVVGFYLKLTRIPRAAGGMTVTSMSMPFRSRVDCLHFRHFASTAMESHVVAQSRRGENLIVWVTQPTNGAVTILLVLEHHESASDNWGLQGMPDSRWGPGGHALGPSGRAGRINVAQWSHIQPLEDHTEFYRHRFKLGMLAADGSTPFKFQDPHTLQWNLPGGVLFYHRTPQVSVSAIGLKGTNSNFAAIEFSR